MPRSKIQSTELYEDSDIIEPLSVRVKRILKLADSVKRHKGKMLFFVMYDIESNKVRNYVAKYLLRNGCFRIQNSIYLAEADNSVYQKIKEDLAKVQECYDNYDSIIVLPVTTDYLNMMKIIGKEIDVDVITHRKNTLFF